MHMEIRDMINSIKDLGLSVKIDTNGSFPDRLSDCGADFIAMDIKTAFSRYSSVLPENIDREEAVEKVRESISLILKSGKPHQFRTTMVPGIVGVEDFQEIIPAIQGAHTYLLSGFRPGNTLDTAFSVIDPYDESIIDTTAELLRNAGIEVKTVLNRTA